MAVREPKNIKELPIESVEKRVEKLKERYEYWLAHIDEAKATFHIQKGNDKTGKNCYTVSLRPILDCLNCSGCYPWCYDIRNDCIYPTVINDRARNAAIHNTDPDWYWNAILQQVIDLKVEELRINVGGDMSNDDFYHLDRISRVVPNTEFLFFTKNYSGLNAFLDEKEFIPSVHKLMSAWPGMEMDNPHNVPCSHVLWSDGTTTAPKDKFSYACNGNCSDCAMHFKANNKLEAGCFGLEAGDNVLFPAH